MIERHSLIPAASLLLVKDDKVLLIRRKNTGYHDGDYAMPAGHVDVGELTTEALVREMKEEIGISFVKEDLILYHVLHLIKDDERINFCFTIEKWSGKIENLEPDKCDDVSWFDFDNLPENIIPLEKEMIERYKDGKIFSEKRI